MNSTIDLTEYSINDLKQLIADANKEIERQQKNQVRDIRQQMERLADELGMTPEQILSFSKRKTNAPIGDPKYCNPADTTQTWTGRGKRPKWFNEEIEKGTDPETMLIK